MSDIHMLLILAVVCAILIAVVGKIRSIRTAVIHSIVFVCYSGLLWYNLLYKGEGGSSLVWLFYLVIAYLLHIIILMLTITLSVRNRKNRLLAIALSLIAIIALVIFLVIFCG
jgi:hypothetical protein